MKNIKEKIKEFSEMIRQYPYVKEFYIGRAILYSKIKQYQKAIKDCKQIHTNYFCYDIESICERNGLIKEAEAFYTKAIKDNRNEIKNYIRRIGFYMRIGKIENAISDCRACLKISPKDETILMLTKILTGKVNK